MLEEVLHRHPNPPEGLTDFAERVRHSDAFLFVSPEYNGSYTAALKNAVDYLKETGMLKRTQETVAVKSPNFGRSSSRLGGTSFKQTNYWYNLTAKAIDSLDGETEYSSKPFVPLQNIQINTSNAPVIVGSNNNVSNNVTVFSQLDQLAQIITESEDISVADRQDVASDIESIKQQLAKPNPNKKVVELLWQNIGRTADLAGAASLGVTVAKGIAVLTGLPIS